MYVYTFDTYSDLLAICLNLQGEHLDVNDCIKEVGCNAPFIAIFGEEGTSSSSMDIKLVVERGNIQNMPSLSIALQCCIASYYIYNIAYPANMVSFMLFLEYVFTITFTQKVPIHITTLIDNLDKM